MTLNPVIVGLGWFAGSSEDDRKKRMDNYNEYGLCGCGKPVKYISFDRSVGACNQHARCHDSLFSFSEMTMKECLCLGGRMFWSDLSKQLANVWSGVAKLGGTLQHGDLEKAETMFSVVLDNHGGRCFHAETPMDAWRNAEAWLLSPDRPSFPCVDIEVVLRACDLPSRLNRTFDVGDTLRMPHYETAGGFRVWAVEGVHLGGEKQEGTYHLKTVDIKENSEIHVPCIILETHPEVELV